MNSIVITGTDKPKVLQRYNYTNFINYLDVSEQSRRTYETGIAQFLTFLNTSNVTPTEAQAPSRETLLKYKEYLKATGHKATTISLYIVSIRKFFEWAETEGIYPNVARGIKGAKISKEHKRDALTISQAQELINSIDTADLKAKRDKAIVLLMLICGLRDIEISRADIEDFRARGDSQVLYLQGKGRDEKTDYVKVPEETEKAIRDYLNARGEKDSTAPLFVSTSNNNAGKRMTTRSISGIAKKRLCNAGYDSDRLTAHSLRHSAVTYALLGGETLENVSQFARHKEITTTMIYNHALNIEKNTCTKTTEGLLFARP